MSVMFSEYQEYIEMANSEGVKATASYIFENCSSAEIREMMDWADNIENGYTGPGTLEGDKVFYRQVKNFIQAIYDADAKKSGKPTRTKQLSEMSIDELDAIFSAKLNEALSKLEEKNEKALSILYRNVFAEVFNQYFIIYKTEKLIEFVTKSKVITPDILTVFLEQYGMILNAEQIIRIINSGNAETKVLERVVDRYYNDRLNCGRIDFSIIEAVLEKDKNNLDKVYVSLELFIEIMCGEGWYGEEIPKKLEQGFLTSDRVNAKVMETCYNLYKKIDAYRKKASNLNQPYLLDWDKYEMGAYSSSDFYGFESKIAALSSLVMDDTGDSAKAKEFIEGFLGKEYASLYERCKAERLAMLSEAKNPSSR